MAMRTALYSERIAACGCRGVPDGQHLPGCPEHQSREAPICSGCGYRAAIEEGRCGICGTARIPPAPTAPLLLSAAELEHPFGPGIESPDRLSWLRTATHGEFRLDLWDTGERPPGGEALLAYRLCFAEGTRWILVFSDEGFRGAHTEEPGSDATVAAILRFCSLRPGEADPVFFERFTAQQIAFAEQHGEALSLWASELT